MKVNPILHEWIALCDELVTALENAYVEFDSAVVSTDERDAQQLIDRARRRLERVKRP